MTESNSATVPRQRSGWVMWLIWVAATCAGVMVTLCGFAVFGLPRFSLLTVGLFLLLSQLLSGAAQHGVLRRRLRRGEGNWFEHTLIGVGQGVIVGSLVSAPLGFCNWLIIGATGMGGAGFEAFDRAQDGMATVVLIGVLVGLLVFPAIQQRKVLRWHGERADLWLLAGSLGWGIGVSVAWVVLKASGGAVEGTGLIAGFLAASLVMGLLVGGITGAALVYILRGTPAVAQHIEPSGVDGDTASAEVITPDDPDVWG